jgi:hypothetical protein
LVPWFTSYSIEHIAQVLDVPLSQARRWARFRILQPCAREGRKFLYTLDELMVGAVVRGLQRTFGEQSSLPFALAPALRQRLRGFLRWGQDPPYPGAIAMRFDHGPLAVEVEVNEQQLDEIAARLNELAREEKR